LNPEAVKGVGSGTLSSHHKTINFIFATHTAQRKVGKSGRNGMLSLMVGRTMIMMMVLMTLALVMFMVTPGSFWARPETASAHALGEI